MTVSTVTKSIRLTGAEAKALREAAQQATISEAALMKKWVIEGMRLEKLRRAIQAYMDRDADLRGGAAMAGLSYNRFLHELQKRRIVILEDDHFLDRLAELGDMVDSNTLRQAAEQIAS